MGLRAKFNLALVATFLVALVATLGLGAILVYRDVERQMLHEAALLGTQAEITRSYTAREVTPLLTLQDSGFLPQSVPFWVLHNNFRALEDRLPDYSVRFPALNPTNPANSPEPWQRELIERFRADTDLGEVITTRDTADGRMLTVARPIAVSDQACLACHGTPEAAPAGYTDLFGTENGFGWLMGEIVGAQMISVPMDTLLARAKETLTMLAAGVFVIFLVAGLAINLALHLLVIAPINRLSSAAGDVSFDGAGTIDLPVRGKDEIAGLTGSVNRMRAMLVKAMQMLETGAQR